MKLQSSLIRNMVCVMLMGLAVTLLPGSARADADSCQSTQESGLTCTNFGCLTQNMDNGSPGIMTDITKYISDVIGESSKQLFKAFTGNPIYKSAVTIAATLMIIIYALGFMIGVAQPSFGQVLTRLFKIGIIFTLISPSGWDFFSQYVVTFFNKGTDQIIGNVMAIGTGSTYHTGDSPFLQIDGLAKMVLSPDFIVMILGSLAASGPFGLGMGALLMFAMSGLLAMLVDGLIIYALSFVMRALLFGVAPLFIVFLLFEKTKPLFTGWLNSLVNLSVKPILYFTFLSFFIVMLQSSAKDMVNVNDPEKKVEMCWKEFKNVQGSANKGSFWTFRVGGKDVGTQGWDWQGSISCRMSGNANCSSFPLDIINLLSFLILIYVAKKFSGVVESIAAEISNTSVNIDKNLRMDIGKAAEKEKTPANKNEGEAADKVKKSDVSANQTRK